MSLAFESSAIKAPVGATAKGVSKTKHVKVLLHIVFHLFSSKMRTDFAAFD